MPFLKTAHFLEERMKLKSRCLPLGALPYENISSVTRMIAKLYEKMPYPALLPLLDPNDNILNRTLQNIPGIVFEGGNIKLKVGNKEYKEALALLDKAYNNPSIENLEPYSIQAPLFEKYLHIIKKFKSPNACINLTGPFTISQILTRKAEDQVLADKSFRKLFIQSVCIKALWAINKIHEFCPNTTPIIILEEPLLGKLGMLKRDNEDITSELITSMFSRVIEKIKETGALVGIQCLEKCDWQIPINAGVDIISFDAYNNPNNLNIIPEKVTEFILNGGMINWGIIPVMTEAIIKDSNIYTVEKRLFATFDGLILAGVPANLVYNSALVSLQGNADKLPIIFTEKAIMLANQLAKKIPPVI